MGLFDAIFEIPDLASNPTTLFDLELLADASASPSRRPRRCFFSASGGLVAMRRRARCRSGVR